jgi:hypothetical protein
MGIPFPPAAHDGAQPEAVMLKVLFTYIYSFDRFDSLY